MQTSTLFSRLKGTAALSALACATFAAAPAFAQSAAPVTKTAATPAEPAADEIVVTGTIFRRTATETSSPVDVVKADSLDTRGIATIQDAIQQLASNNGPALTNSFTANGAFAGGASAVSLRGLSTNSTLVLFDGLRAAYYPLADDGSRNFVDLNTIPEDIIDRIEVLRDGASSTYGADAIAGVVNIITKKEFKGLGGRVEAGISERGDAAQYRMNLTAGFGDLATNGINAYVSGFYYKTSELENQDRKYPFNSDDLRGVCYDGSCGGNSVLNGQGAALISTGANFLVRPYASAGDPTFATPQGRWQNLSGCGNGTARPTTAAEAGTANPSTVCTYDSTKLWGTISPRIERFGGSMHVAALVGDSIDAYGEINFIQTTSSYDGAPATFYGNAPTGISYPQFSTSSNYIVRNPDGTFGINTTRSPGSAFLSLPVYVCAARVNCATAADRRLNPNNPFAASNQVARLVGRITEKQTYNETRNRAYRAALGVKGAISDNWAFDVGATAMHTDLRRTQKGYVYIQRLLDVIADGSFNFRNPLSNTPAQFDYLMPDNITNSTSDMLQAQATLSTTLFELPGGPMQLGFGGSIRYEAVDAPSANDDYNGPTQRYFTLNAFGTKGSRKVYSAFAELDAPVIDQVTVNASGRYDKYSSGQDAFSPKIGVKFTPVRQVLLRGTYSKGFRIPSFGEANALPTTGYVANTAALFNNAYLAQYGCTLANFATVCPTYIRSGSYGQTTLASPNLKPEKSRSFTGGLLLEPFRNVSFTVDYYNIKKTGAITSPSNAPALSAYYTNGTIPAGYTVIADGVDPAFPNAKPRVAFVQAQLINANTLKTSGIDFGANTTVKLSDGITWNSTLSGSYIIKLSQIVDGVEERYDGTLGNFNLTAGNGTSKWKGYWQNSLEFNRFRVSGTVNYYGGYDLSAMDQGTDYKDCGLSSGFTPCHTKGYWTVDLSGQVKVNEKFTVYGSINNVLDDMPPLDPVTYGAHLYNAVQGGNGILGRYFRAGVKFGF